MDIEEYKNVLFAAFFERKESGSHEVVASPKVPKGSLRENACEIETCNLKVELRFEIK